MDKILIVDDQENNRLVIEDILRKQLTSIRSVCSGKEALETVKSAGFGQAPNKNEPLFILFRIKSFDSKIPNILTTSGTFKDIISS